MLENLKDNELQVATKLIFDGLSMAKSSMEMVLQSPITLEKVDFGEKDSVMSDDTDPDAKVHVIKTALMGELKGSCFLIFTENDVNRVLKACLPENVIKDDSAEGNMMKMGFLTEIDNMVAAAVITEFSNFLKMEIYGGVPSLHIKKSDEVNNYIKSDISELDQIIHFKAIFNGKELNISPDFIWVIHQKFVDKIKSAI
jgi:chemotaxis protein CheY-P-specific phosphatase CheC